MQIRLSGGPSPTKGRGRERSEPGSRCQGEGRLGGRKGVNLDPIYCGGGKGVNLDPSYLWLAAGVKETIQRF